MKINNDVFEKFPEIKYYDFDQKNDERGYFVKTFSRDNFFDKDISFDEIYHSTSRKNVIRGIHYDSKTFKLVTAVYGEIDQVVVDMRKDSETYKESLIFNIQDSNRFSILVPPMVGNGFRVKSDIAVYHYKLSYLGEYLDSKNQYTLKWDDSTIGINWDCDNPILSNRDS